MRINTNVSALNTFRNLNNTGSAVSRSMEKLSSGFRINRAGDDAAGLAIANKLRSDGRALGQASRNAAQANSMLQIADGAVNTISAIVDRMKELATQAASDTIGTGGEDQRVRLQAEFTALNDEITRIIDTTKYQGVRLLDGASAGSTSVTGGTYTDAGSDIAEVRLSGTAADTYTISSDADANGVVTVTNGAGDEFKVLADDGAQTLRFEEIGLTIVTGAGFKIGDGTDPSSFDTRTIIVTAAAGPGNFDIQLGATNTAEDRLTLDLGTLSALGAFDISDKAAAQTAMDDLETLASDVNSFVGKLGSMQNRVDYAMQNLATSIQNYAAAESTIRDVDMAEEMTVFSKNQILQQAGTAMLAQANQLGQGVLQLLRG